MGGDLGGGGFNIILYSVRSSQLTPHTLRLLPVPDHSPFVTLRATNNDALAEDLSQEGK